MRSLTHMILGVLGLPSTVKEAIAGHALFEAKPGHASSTLSTDTGGFRPLLDSNTSFADPFDKSDGLDCRWVVVDTTDDRIRLWPDRTIKYCFEDTESKAKLHDLILEAMGQWYKIGLHETFKMEEVSDSECRDNKLNVLTVTYDKPKSQGGQSILSTTPAKPVGQRPSMILSDDTLVGTNNVVGNIAHEIGHAWGMHHEHQNPYFWPTKYAGRDGNLFSAINWVCSNLADYQTALENVQKAIDAEPLGPDLGEVLYGNDREQMCYKRAIAARYGFSAKEYLPLTVQDGFNPGTRDKEDIDWKSIMIYPSGAGGIQDGNGNRAVALRKPNGDPIPKNTEPTTRDVAGLMALYGWHGNFDEILLNAENNRKKGKFTEIRNADIGVHCST